MALKYAKGKFIPKNPQKYKGKTPIIYRSSWELRMMQTFDTHPSIIAWQSETVTIPYKNPFTNSWTVYIPDFLVLYQDAKGLKHCDLIEVKPLKEVGQQFRNHTKQLKETKKDKMFQILNAAKWKEAFAFCKKRGWNFRIMTAEDIFGHAKPRSSVGTRGTTK